MKGTSLAEVLVALVVVCLGVLSAMSLQLASKRALAEAAQRSLAARVARELAQEIRVHGRPAESGALLDADADRGLVLPTACLGEPDGGGDGAYTLTLAWRGSVPLPPDATVRCGLDPQPDGARLYSERDDDNRYRRTLTLPLAVTAARRPG